MQKLLQPMAKQAGCWETGVSSDWLAALALGLIIGFSKTFSEQYSRLRHLQPFFSSLFTPQELTCSTGVWWCLICPPHVFPGRGIFPCKSLPSESSASICFSQNKQTKEMSKTKTKPQAISRFPNIWTSISSWHLTIHLSLYFSPNWKKTGSQQVTVLIAFIYAYRTINCSV